MSTSPPRHQDDEDTDESQSGWELGQRAKTDPYKNGEDGEEEDDEDEYGGDDVKQEPWGEDDYVKATPTRYPVDTTKVCYQYSGGYGVCGALPGDPAYHACPNDRPHACKYCGQPHQAAECDADEETKRKAKAKRQAVKRAAKEQSRQHSKMQKPKGQDRGSGKEKS